MNIIQVGMGGMGNAWLSAVQASNEVSFAGFVEVNNAVAEDQLQRYGIQGVPVFGELAVALKNVNAEGVINVTPPQFHKEISVMALEAGVPVLSEKPLAENWKEAVDIVEVANRTGVLHMVTQNYRYKPPIQTLKHALQNFSLGDVGAVTVEFFKGPHFGGFRERMAYPLVVDMAIHHFDLMRFLLESNPASVLGRSWNPPWSWFSGDASAAVLFEFANGVHVTYNGSWCSQGGETGWNADWRFECARGVVSMVNDVVTVQETGKEPLTVAPVAMDSTDQAYLLHEFYQSLVNKTVPPTSCQDNLHSLGMVFDAIRSFETGQQISCVYH